MERTTYEFVLECREPIAHHSETAGNEQILMRMKVRLPNGRFTHIPIVTGDTMRHGLREAAALATLSAAGLLHEGADLSEGALRLLFAGGMLSGKGGDASTVKLDRYRELVDLFPPLAIFGGCAENRCIPGSLQVGPAILICEEAARLLDGDGWAADMAGGLSSHRGHVTLEQRVRMDPMLRPQMRKLLSADARASVEGRLLASEAASAEGDYRAKEDAASTMMPRSYEVIVAGSLLYWQVTVTTWTELERDCFLTALAAFLYDAHVGGKRSTGHGRLVPAAARQLQIARPSYAAEAINPNGLAGRAGALYRAHVEARADALRAWLCGGVDA